MGDNHDDGNAYDNADEVIEGDEANETEDEADTSNDDKNTDAEDDSNESDDESEDDESDEGSDEDSEGNSDEETDTADEDESEDEEDDGSEPELRKPKKGAPNSEWAAYRKQQKAKKEAAGEDKDEGGDESEDEDDDDLDPNDEESAKIQKIIDKELKPYRDAEAEREVDTEIATFLQDNPDFKPYAAKVKRFALHPSRAQLPVKSVFYEVAGDKLMKIGAKRAMEAAKKANKTKTGGGNANADGKGNKSYSNMDLKDFEKELNEAKLNRN